MIGYDSESALIGCLLLDPNCSTDVFATVTANMIQNADLRLIFQCIQTASVQNRHYDSATVITGLPNEQLKEKAVYCCDTVPALSSVDEYVKAVVLGSAKKRVFDIAQDMINSQLVGEDVSIDDLVERVNEMGKSLNGVQETNATSSSDAVLMFERDMNETPEYFKLGFPTIDSNSYIEAGDLIVIGGRPSAGKTMVSLNMMQELAKKHKVVYFSLETSAKKITERIVSSFCQIPLWKIKKRKMGAEDWEAWHHLKHDFKDLNFEIVEASGKSVQWIKNEAVRRKAEVVIVDYLGIVNGRGKNQYEMVTNAIHDFHTMSQSEKIVTIILCQINRASLMNEAPSMADLKDSGAIEADADIIILLHNKGKEGYNAILAKNKSGKTGTVPCIFDGECQRITEKKDDKSEIVGHEDFEEVPKQTGMPF